MQCVVTSMDFSDEILIELAFPKLRNQDFTPAMH